MALENLFIIIFIVCFKEDCDIATSSVNKCSSIKCRDVTFKTKAAMCLSSTNISFS